MRAQRQGKISGDNLVSFICELNKHLIELLKLLCTSGRRDGNVVVGNGGEQLKTIRDFSSKLKVKGRLNAKVLLVSKGNATCNRTTLLNRIVRTFRLRRLNSPELEHIALSELRFVCLQKCVVRNIECLEFYAQRIIQKGIPQKHLRMHRVAISGFNNFVLVKYLNRAWSNDRGVE